MTTPRLILRPGRQKSLLRRHPWVFSGSIHQVDGNPAPGATVELLSSTGEFLARAAFSPHSQIRARVWTFDPSEAVGKVFFRKRIRRALAARGILLLSEPDAASPSLIPFGNLSTPAELGGQLAEAAGFDTLASLATQPAPPSPPAERGEAGGGPQREGPGVAPQRGAGSPLLTPFGGASRGEGSGVRSNALRLIYAESDGLPGLIVDRYADVLVAQFLTAGAEFWRETLADLLLAETGLATIYERSDADVRELEGLPTRTGLLRGVSIPPLTINHPPLTITEHGLQFKVDIAAGHKTGFYLDQRENRLCVRALSTGRDVLDCFCYTGGFTVNALAGGAKSVLSVDSSADALALCAGNVALNALPASRHTALEGDVFQFLRKFRDEGRSFDLIVLDPPKFAPTAAQAEKATRAYKDINLLAFKLLRSGGILVTFSCSGGVDAALFQKIVAGAALDAGVEAQIVEHLSQAPDHPVALNFPEGAYLKGLVCLKS